MNAPAWKPDAARLERVPCPLCGGRSFQTLATSDRYDMDLVTAGCRQCGLVMTNPQPTEAALDTFYRDHYRHYYQKTERPDPAYIKQYRKDERAAQTAAFLQAQGALRPGAKVLDIGASEGCILRAIADLEVSTQRVAVEPNPTFGAFAVEHAGCELHASVDALRQTGATGFDLVVINHVYEHVKHPVEFLADLRGLLAPGARIYIDVPDVTAYRRIEDLHIAHLYHFGPDTLDRAARLAGYEVLLLERHAPLMHPLSLRCLLTPGKAVSAPALHNLREGWAAVVRLNRRAAHFHRKRWPWLKRMQHRLGLRKPATV